MFVRFLLLFVLLGGYPGPSARAQSSPPKIKPVGAPKIGVVLSGGGAKGYAHIGALQVLEEAGVEVDFIGGTSMGSIIAGLYAAGYSADQLEQLLRETDIMSILVDELPRGNYGIYERLNNERYVIELSMKDFSIQLPAGYSDGQRVHDLLAHWTAHVGHIRDFSQLPIPYLAVATDMQTGDDVVLKEGILAEAMRASAALPGVLTPYPIDGKLLTDGGVSNNYPAEEVRAMGADYVLGISVEADPLTASEINSVTDILMQIAFFQANRRNVEQYEETHLDIRPDLKEYSVLSFEAIDSLIARGRRAARAELDALREIAEIQGGQNQRDTSDVQIPEDLVVAEVNVTGNTRLSDRQVLSYFKGQIPGVMSWDAFRRSLIDLYSTKRFRNINYSWTKSDISDDPSVRLNLEVVPYEDPGQRLRLGLHYDENYETSLLLGLQLSDLIVDNTELNLNLIASRWLRYNMDFRVNRINGSAFGFRSGLQYVENNFRLPQPVNSGGLQLEKIEFTFQDVSAEAYWDFRRTDNSLTGLAIQLKRYDIDSEQLNVDQMMVMEGFRTGYDLFLVPRLYLQYDKLDSFTFPFRGFSIDARLRAIRNLTLNLNDEDSEWDVNLDVNFLGLLPLDRRVALGIETNFGLFLNQRSALPFRYYLGGVNRNFMNNFKRFPGLEIAEATGTTLASADAFLRAGTFANQYLEAGIVVGYLNNPEELPSSRDEEQFYAAKLAYGISTPIGPLKLTYAYGTASSALYFNAGFWF